MSLRMLVGHHELIAGAQTVDEFRRRVVGFARSLDFETVNAMTVIDHSVNHTSFHCIDNTPEAFRDRWCDQGASKIDPVMQHCKYSAAPIVWDQSTYVSHGRVDLWEEQAKYGFKIGICLALHLPGGLHFCLGVDRDKRFRFGGKTLTRVLADLQMFAVHAQEASLRIFAPKKAFDFAEGSPHLTSLELEALRWTMDGRSTWAVARALNISEYMADFHLRNATRKLQCGSKFQAVLKAIRLGLFA